MLLLAVIACVAVLALARVSESAPNRRAERRVDNNLARKGSRAINAFDPEMTRLEHAIDALAIEVERVGENQRFLTKLLAEPSPTEKG